MSDNIPWEIQTVIMERLPVKSLLKFRTVAKTWKSFIDSRNFLVSYAVQPTQPSRFLVSYEHGIGEYEQGTGEVVRSYICFIDDNSSYTRVQEFPPCFQYLRSTNRNSWYYTLNVIGSSHGLLCFFCNKFATLWNPSIRKSVGIAFPYDPTKPCCGITVPYNPTKGCCEKISFGFGVHPENFDPTILMISYPEEYGPWTGYLFTLSSGYWKTLPASHLLRETIRLKRSSHIAIGCFIYWAASERTVCDDGILRKIYMIVSFDLNTQRFQLIDLPFSLRVQLPKPFYTCKLGESLVIYGEDDGHLFVAWGLEIVRGSITSFKMLFSINTHRYLRLLGFTKNSEPIVEAATPYYFTRTLEVYQPLSQKFRRLGIDGDAGSFLVSSYNESLILSTHSDGSIQY